MPVTPAQAVASESWMDKANCAYGNKEMVGGMRVFRPDGTAVMSYDEFVLAMDRLFFGGHDDKPSSGDESRKLFRAVQECLTCPVRNECLAYALSNEHSMRNGVYGGTTRWERATVMRSALFSGLPPEERQRILERLVEAKAMGWVRLSVPVDHAERAMRNLTDEEWEGFLDNAERMDKTLGRT